MWRRPPPTSAAPLHSAGIIGFGSSARCCDSIFRSYYTPPPACSFFLPRCSSFDPPATYPTQASHPTTHNSHNLRPTTSLSWRTCELRGVATSVLPYCRHYLVAVQTYPIQVFRHQLDKPVWVHSDWPSYPQFNDSVCAIHRPLIVIGQS